MARTREEIRDYAMELSEADRLRLAEDLVGSIEPGTEWRQAWIAEAERRYQRMVSGEDPGLTLEEFWADDDEP
ncbi:MAG TPA: addiction module protein [Thermoanaerobaculia bacterium]|nr:addiction module protein [Thermoanaerobaculia bacterium]